MLFAATVTGHINAFHISYLKWFKEQCWETYFASFPEEGIGQIPYCDVFHKIPFTRNPFAASNVRSYRLIKKLIETTDFDIIHCHTPVTVSGALTRLTARSARMCKTQQAGGASL